MNCKIPFVKDIDFEKKLYEITSISLEHELSTKEESLKGNFIISGDYKSHEVSVNKEPFSYILPFEIDLAPEIDRDTIEFMIEDFTYEIVDNTILRVKIDFNVIASKKEILKEEEEVVFRDANELFLDNEEELSNIEELSTDLDKIEAEINTTNEKEERELLSSENTITENLNTEDNAFTTYHIHIVADGESIDTICSMYNTNLNILNDYNDLATITSGDKLIIPEKNE